MGFRLLKISYDRVVDIIEVLLTDENYESYGFLKDDTGYYKYDSEAEENVYFTHGEEEVKDHFSHILPNPSKFTPIYSDVDKEGSGRNESDGLMVRERLGHYCSIDIQWDVLPNSVERINLVRILRNLPPRFNLEYHDSDNEFYFVTNKEFYRADINEDLYMFTEDKQIWTGLSTTFIQFNVDKYDDSIEPQLLEVEGKPIYIYDSGNVKYGG